jgi:hypothetical protein
MTAAVRAGIAYFATLFALGFLLGSLREMATRAGWPRGPLVLAEIPVMLAFAWVAAGWCCRRFAVPLAVGHRIGMGLVMLVLLRLGELAVGTLLMGHTFRAQLAADISPAGLLESLPQALTAAFPLLHRTVSR